MLDPLPPSPSLLSPLTTDSFLGPYAHRKNVENVDIDDDDDDDDELTPRFNLTPGYEDKRTFELPTNHCGSCFSDTKIDRSIPFLDTFP